MLTMILSIGPLTRLDRRFLPLLYNRRHFGVLTFFVVLLHASFMVEWYAVQDACVVKPLDQATHGDHLAQNFGAFVRHRSALLSSNRTSASVISPSRA